MISVRKQGAFSRRVDRVRRLMTKGPQFSDSYSIGDLICEGSQGAVYRCYDKSDPTKGLAVKIIQRQGMKEHQVKQILREVAIMRNLSDLEHTNKAVDFFQSSKRFYIVQELALGGDVFDYVVNSGHYDEHDARIFATKLLQTIQEYHSRGYIHRDLKPENLLLMDKTNTSLRIADWGFGTLFDPENPPIQKCGTPCYTPPEVLEGKPYDQAVDLWSTGCIFYTILSGSPAFHAKDPKEMFRKIKAGEFRFNETQWKGISKEARECIKGLLTVDPKARWTPDQALSSDWLSARTQSTGSLPARIQRTQSLPQ